MRTSGREVRQHTKKQRRQGHDRHGRVHDAGFDQMVEDEISKRSGAGFA